MSIEQSELETFHQFISDRLDNGGSAMTADEALAAFHAHQRDVERLKEHLHKSETDGGEELDIDAVKTRTRKRLSENGVTD